MGTDDTMNKYLNGFICLRVKWWVQGMGGVGAGKELFCFNVDQWQQSEGENPRMCARVFPPSQRKPESDLS